MEPLLVSPVAQATAPPGIGASLGNSAGRTGEQRATGACTRELKSAGRLREDPAAAPCRAPLRAACARTRCP